VEGRYYLGLALADLKQHTEAIQELERVVQSGPKMADAYLSLGGAYIEAGRFDDALEILSQGTHIDAARRDLRILLARAYRSKGVLDRAEEQLKIASSNRTALASPFFQDHRAEFDLNLEQGLLALQQGRLEAAIAAFQKVLASDPDYAPAKRHLGDARRLLQDRLQKKKSGGRG
jgi:tetratricopeptide (TPR) repeat protein